MTKKAAKKKTAKKKVAKSSEDKAAKGAEVEEKKESQTESIEGKAEAPKEIKVVEEAAPEDLLQKQNGGGEAKGRRPERDRDKRSESGSSRRSGGPRRSGGRRAPAARPPIDEEELGIKSWKVFQQEIAEEGLALIDESSARQLAEKSIIVTRAFLEERERRLGKGKNAPKPVAEKDASSSEPAAPKEESVSPVSEEEEKKD